MTTRPAPRRLTPLLLSLLLLAGGEARAQISAADLLEKARAQAGGLEELKGVLNGPDANMRIATFDVMVNSGDDSMREVALDLGLASSDRVLQSLAFKHAIMSLAQIHFVLAPDPSASEQVQAKSANAVGASGNAFVLKLGHHDPKTGRFALGKSYLDRGTYSGEVSGLTLTFHYGNDSGSFQLEGDDRLVGRMNGPSTQYTATAKIR